MSWLLLVCSVKIPISAQNESWHLRFLSLPSLFLLLGLSFSHFWSRPVLSNTAIMMGKSLFALSNVVASGHICSVSSAAELDSQVPTYWAVWIQTTATPFKVLHSGLTFCTEKPPQLRSDVDSPSLCPIASLLCLCPHTQNFTESTCLPHCPEHFWRQTQQHECFSALLQV